MSESTAEITPEIFAANINPEVDTFDFGKRWALHALEFGLRSTQADYDQQPAIMKALKELDATVRTFSTDADGNYNPRLISEDNGASTKLIRDSLGRFQETVRTAYAGHQNPTESPDVGIPQILVRAGSFTSPALGNRVIGTAINGLQQASELQPIQS